MLIIGTRIKALLSPALKSFTDNKDGNNDFWWKINGKSNDMNFNRQKFKPDQELSTEEKHMRRVLSRLISRWPSLIVSFYEKLNCHLCKTKLNCFVNLLSKAVPDFWEVIPELGFRFSLSSRNLRKNEWTDQLFRWLRTDSVSSSVNITLQEAWIQSK